jgi:hypothetical protein
VDEAGLGVGDDDPGRARLEDELEESLGGDQHGLGPLRDLSGGGWRADQRAHARRADRGAVAAAFEDRLDERVALREQAGGARDERRPVLGQANARHLAVEQPRADDRLELGDALGDRRPADAQTTARAGQAAVGSARHERLELGELGCAHEPCHRRGSLPAET